MGLHKPKRQPMHQQATLFRAVHLMAYAEIKIQMRGVTKVRKIVKKRVRENTLIPTHHQLSAVHGEAFAKTKIQILGVTKERKIVKKHVTENTLIPTHHQLSAVHGEA